MNTRTTEQKVYTYSLTEDPMDDSPSKQTNDEKRLTKKPLHSIYPGSNQYGSKRKKRKS